MNQTEVNATIAETIKIQTDAMLRAFSQITGLLEKMTGDICALTDEVNALKMQVGAIEKKYRP